MSLDSTESWRLVLPCVTPEFGEFIFSKQLIYNHQTEGEILGPGKIYEGFSGMSLIAAQMNIEAKINRILAIQI